MVRLKSSPGEDELTMMTKSYNWLETVEDWERRSRKEPQLYNDEVDSFPLSLVLDVEQSIEDLATKKMK